MSNDDVKSVNTEYTFTLLRLPEYQDHVDGAPVSSEPHFDSRRLLSQIDDINLLSMMQARSFSAADRREFLLWFPQSDPAPLSLNRQ